MYTYHKNAPLDTAQHRAFGDSLDNNSVSSTSCVCWCTAAWTEQHQDTCPTWQCLSAVPHVVSYAQRRPLIWWYHQHVRRQLENRAFAVAGPRAWNSLPPALRSTSKSFSSFKKELKSFLFGFWFWSWQREHLLR